MVRRRVLLVALIFASAVTGGAAVEGPGQSTLGVGAPVAVRKGGGNWSWWVSGTRQDQPFVCETLPPELGPAPGIHTSSGMKLFPRGGTRMEVDARRVLIDRGLVVVVAGQWSVRVEAAGSHVTLESGVVRVRCDDTGRVLLLVERGTIIFGGRTHRAGTAMRWHRGMGPALRTWPRGDWVRPASGSGVKIDTRRRPAVALAGVRDDPGAPSTVRAAASLAWSRVRRRQREARAPGSWSEARFRRDLLRICAEGRRPDRWLGLALLLEAGTATERAAAADLATPAEVRRLVHVLRSMADSADARVGAAARSALVRAGELRSLGRRRIEHRVPLTEALADRIESALGRPGEPDADTRINAWSRDGFSATDLESALQCGGPSNRLALAERDRRVAPVTARSLLDDPRVVRLVRERAKTAASKRALLDAVERSLRSCSDSEVPELVASLEDVLGRSVSGALVDQVGLRKAALQTIRTVARSFQPPGEDLLLW